MSIIALVTFITTVASVFVAVSAWWYSRSDRVNKTRTDRITRHIDEALRPIVERMTVFEQRIGPDAKEHDRLTMKGMIVESLEPVREQVTSMSVKVETLWANLAVSMAQILHQPDPARAHVDVLLEAFMNGTLTSDERVELRKHLITIKSWEEGKPSDYPIIPGEQTAAAILLALMDDRPGMVLGGVIKK